jgi:hypothetical protein
VTPTTPITRHDLDILSRSLAASGQLSRDQVAWVLTESRRLLEERAELARVLHRLGPPWHDVRSVLNELHAVLGGGA